MPKLPHEEKVRPAGFYSELVIDGLAVIFAAASGFAASLYLVGGLEWYWFFLIFTFWLSASAILTAATPGFLRRFLIFLGEMAAFLILLGVRAGGYFAWGAVIFAIACFSGVWSARSDFQNYLTIKFYRSVSRQVRKSVIGCLLLALAVLVPSYLARGQFLTSRQFSALYNPAASFMKQIYGEIDLQGSVSDLSKSLTQYQLSQDSRYKLLPEDIKSQLFVQAYGEVQKEVVKVLGSETVENEPVSKAAERALNNVLVGWREKYGQVFSAVWIIGLFFALRVVALAYSYLVAFWSYLVYQFLVSMGIVSAFGESKMQEVIRFS